MFRLTVRGPGYAVAQITLAALSASLLWPGHAAPQGAPAQPPQPKTVHITGKVLGPAGQPAPGAAVGVVSSGRAYERLDGLLTDQCGEGGAFDLVVEDAERYPGEPVTYRVWARSTDGRLMGSETITDNPPKAAVEVRLKPPGYLHAKVVDPKGQPVAEIPTELVLEDRGRPAVGAIVKGPATDAKGEVLVGPLPAEVSLTFRPAYEVSHLVLHDPWREALQGGLALQPGQTLELPPLTLDPEGRSVQGVLLDPDGKPLPGAKVACHLPQWPVNSATADDQGRFRLTRLPVKGYDVWLIAAKTDRKLYVMSSVDPDAGQDVRLGLRPLTSASGILARADGQPLGEVAVEVFPMLHCRQAGQEVWTFWQTEWLRERPQAGKTAADGSWSATGLVAGASYSLQVRLPDGTGLGFGDSMFEVDAEGKPTDVGVTVLR